MKYIEIYWNDVSGSYHPHRVTHGCKITVKEWTKTSERIQKVKWSIDTETPFFMGQNLGACSGPRKWWKGLNLCIAGVGSSKIASFERSGYLGCLVLVDAFLLPNNSEPEYARTTLWYSTRRDSTWWRFDTLDPKIAQQHSSAIPSYNPPKIPV